MNHSSFIGLSVDVCHERDNQSDHDLLDCELSPAESVQSSLDNALHAATCCMIVIVNCWTMLQNRINTKNIVQVNLRFYITL